MGFYYTCMASSMSGQDAPNQPLRLATQAGKMELSFMPRIAHHVMRENIPRKPSNKPFSGQAFSIKIDPTLGQ